MMNNIRYTRPVWLKNHTRRIPKLVFALFAISIMVSCASDKYDYNFKSSHQALDFYHTYLTDLKLESKVSSKDLSARINEWEEMRDTVLNYIRKDSSYTAHTWLSSSYSHIDDFVKQVFINSAVSQNYTLKDIVLIKRMTSVYAKDEEVLAARKEAEPFFQHLDSLKPYNVSTAKTLSMYRSFLSESKNSGMGSTPELKAYISLEDRLFRTFLVHFSDLMEVSMPDITGNTTQICNRIYQKATEGKLNAKEVMTYMTMRTNRRLIQNAEVCIRDMKSKPKMSPVQQNAYFWVMIQPFIAPDNLGMTLLTDKQYEKVCAMADDIQSLDKRGRLGDSNGRLSKINNLILKLYITSL
ncbi:hypothetical protein [Segatella bryantii]|nr:hypothetical protein [Segatella bryantii]UKK80010.1 hypothetical protein L6474_04895 [Segatella bryantii]